MSKRQVWRSITRTSLNLTKLSAISVSLLSVGGCRMECESLLSVKADVSRVQNA